MEQKGRVLTVEVYVFFLNFDKTNLFLEKDLRRVTTKLNLKSYWNLIMIRTGQIRGCSSDLRKDYIF